MYLDLVELCVGSETRLCGDTGGRDAADGLTGDVTSKYRVDRIEEAGLPGTDWSEEQNPSLGHGAVDGYVVLDIRHVLHFPPAETSLMPITA